jgi:hypothetical protein
MFERIKATNNERETAVRSMDNEVDSMGHELYALIPNNKRRLIVEFINLAGGEKYAKYRTGRGLNSVAL